MGKKRVSVLGTESEDEAKAKHSRQLEQKKLRQGKTAKAPGLAGGQRVVDTAQESLDELAIIEGKLAESLSQKAPAPTKKIRARSKPYLAAKSQIDANKTYSLPDGLALLRKVSLTKFDPTVELHLTLLDSFSKDVELPHSTGKTRRIAIADDTTVSKIEKGQIDFDVLLASPAQMSKLVKLAKTLGPRGLMPNPKSGTVVADPETAAISLSGKNSLTLKTEKDTPVIHTIVGKLSLSDKASSDNISAILTTLPRVKKTVLKSTMSPAIKITI